MAGEKNILWFKEVGKDDTAIVGGKGANLGEMFNTGLPVPNGYIVTAQAYFKFLEESGLKEKIEAVLKDFDAEDSKDLQDRAQKCQDLIANAEMPKDLKKEIIENYQTLKSVTKSDKLFVAVRSSATAEDLADASFAGQQATYLNVIGDEEVVKAVQKCWASLFEARAIYYRNDKGFGQLEVGIAVPIQKMVDSEKAGVMFTIDPTNNDLTKISIEAAYGLGEVVVLGAQTPDRYLVDKKSLEILDKEINKQTWKLTRESGSSDTDDLSNLEKESIPVPEADQEKQKLNDAEIKELAKIAVKIEEHYGKPQDTEWGIEKGKIYMLQSRPVTTLGDSVASSEVASKGTKNPVILATEGSPESKDSGRAGMTNKGEANVLLKGGAASVGSASGTVKIIHSPKEIDKILGGDVLVTEMTTPDFVPAMKRAVAIITDLGGRTCHAAIVSRELGIPCVVGTQTATKDLKNGQVVTVDGGNGVVYKGKVASENSKQQTENSGSNKVSTGEAAPVTATKIYVILGEPELAEKISKMNVDGVGLLRAEFIIANMGKHPRAFIKEGKSQEFVDKLAADMEIFADSFDPRPVVYRATDFKTNEYRNLEGGAEFEPNEENPMIGYRGCFRYIKEPDLYNLELEAIKKVRKNYKNLHLMIPFVRTVEEFAEVKRLTEESGLLKDKEFKFWIMVEVPSAYFLIEKYCQMGIDGISIGSNDLTQLVLGLDRDNQGLAELFDERNEAVQESIKHVIEVCRKYNVTTSICGQAPSVYPEVSEMLVSYGINSISVSPDMIDTTRKLVAGVEEKLLLKELAEVKTELKDVEERLDRQESSG
ncbi:MAG: phosphoenolpyruvate synthase [Patescibacteria group bacterium]|nr:phosphoenolpyruvate synthase [Patescibacteria group bacterium]MCL5093646.1 phosphoenolpyruvate synthase [Patescibacteria group bacterium]